MAEKFILSEKTTVFGNGMTGRYVIFAFGMASLTGASSVIFAKKRSMFSP
jgi:hypothetical protein